MLYSSLVFMILYQLLLRAEHTSRQGVVDLMTDDDTRLPSALFSFNSNILAWQNKVKLIYLTDTHRSHIHQSLNTVDIEKMPGNKFNVNLSLSTSASCCQCSSSCKIEIFFCSVIISALVENIKYPITQALLT